MICELLKKDSEMVAYLNYFAQLLAQREFIVRFGLEKCGKLASVII